MIIATFTGGGGRYGSIILARFKAGGTGSPQALPNHLTNQNLGSETSTVSVLEPVENHAQQLSCVKGCNPDRIRASILSMYKSNKSQQPSTSLRTEHRPGYWTPKTQVHQMKDNYNFKKEHAIFTHEPWFITAQELKNLRKTGSIAGETA